jgi:folate-binding protein YgfZ
MNVTLPPDDAARRARSAGITAAVASRDEAAGAALGLLVAEGPDAASFLHSQLTQDITGLQPGEGRFAARVSRTGHVEHLLSVHRDPTVVTRFYLLTEADDIARLRDDLDAALFADDLTLTVRPVARWRLALGPSVPAALDAALGTNRWATVDDGHVAEVAEGGLVMRRALGGDPGLVSIDPSPAFEDAFTAALTAAGGVDIDATTFAAALDALRVEAGVARIGPETTGKRRLLPETGMETTTVSYSKGCYLGQEVIARVRTYGSVPQLLRALLTEAPADALPPIGAPLLRVDGTQIGAIASRARVPSRTGWVALAYLDRAHRTPGATWELQGPQGSWSATVATLPLHAAADTAARVAQRYDSAIRRFAGGDVDGALRDLEAVLVLDPAFADAYEVLGVMLGKAGRTHEAIDLFRRLEEVAPDEPLVHTNLSVYYMQLGDKETAEAEAGKATLKQMARASGRTGRVDADVEAGKRKDAARKRTMFEKVLAFDPDDGIANFGLGQALLTLGEVEAAIDALTRAVTVEPNNAVAYAALGRALERAERRDDAVATYQRGLVVASKRGDLMPLREMEHRLLLLGAPRVVADQ